MASQPEGGRSPPGLQDGPIVGRCGPALAPANRSRSPTPTASDTKGSVTLQRSLEREQQSSRGVRLCEQVVRIEEKNGLLNPAFAAWLMGYPAAWVACAPSATRSFRKSRPKLSAPTSTPNIFD
jgi:hypothetical protein